MLRIVQQLLLTAFFAVFASQASAMFIQPDWFEVTEPGVGTNRYSYSFNDPINNLDPNGNACGGACSEEDQARIDAAEPAPLFDETAASIDEEIARIQKEIAGLPANQAPTTGCNSARDCGVAPGQSKVTQGDLLMLEMNALVGLRSVVPADTTEAGLIGLTVATPLKFGMRLPKTPAVNSFAGVTSKISQKQNRHIGGRPEWEARGKPSYMLSTNDAQAVLDAALSGQTKVLGKTAQGFPVVEYGGVTGFNNNLGAGYINQSTHNFMIKGTTSPSVVPMNPNWMPK